MSSREEILTKLKQSAVSEPFTYEIDSSSFNSTYMGEPLSCFKKTLETLHTEVIEMADLNEIHSYVAKRFKDKRIVANLPNSPSVINSEWLKTDPHQLQDTEFSLIEGRLGVAENGAIWVSEDQMGQRVAPFICQRLGIVLDKKKIVPTLHQAYEKIDIKESGFGVFISGPSKTADIEQSLVLGAHGPKELLVFLI